MLAGILENNVLVNKIEVDEENLKDFNAKAIEYIEVIPIGSSIIDNVVTYNGDIIDLEFEYNTYLSNMVRNKRNKILEEEVDPFIQNTLKFESYPKDLQATILNYRQQLLAIPEQEGFPTTVIWPEKTF